MERSIGVVKNTFRCVLGARQLHYKPEKATQIVNACVALHNLRIKYKMQFSDPEILIDDDRELSEISDTDNTAIRIREEIMNSIL